MANSTPPWAAYCTLLAPWIVLLNKRAALCPMGIRETLLWSLAEIFMRAAGDQVNMACEDLQMCADLKAGIEGSTHDVGQRQREKGKGGVEDHRERRGNGDRGLGGRSGERGSN